MIRRAAIFLTAFVAALGLLYAAGAYIGMETDPRQWWGIGRYFHVALSFVAAGVATAVFWGEP